MTTSDDSLREIQLNGKQLVFLFMAVTVVSVVIFLCGVLVGRGVQPRPIAAAETTTAADAPADPAPDPTADPTPLPTGELPGPTTAGDLDYPGLDKNTLPVDQLVTRPEPARAATPAAGANKTASAQPPAPVKGKSLAPAATGTSAAAKATATDKPAEKPLPPEPKGDGMAIQVAALRGRADAEAVVSRLKGKGYTAYIVPSLAGQPAQFRVRVGKYKTRAEAEKIAARLAQEEQFNPWITR